MRGIEGVRVETTAPGVFKQGEPGLQALAADVATQALGQTPAPIAQADSLVAAVTGEALRATVRMRVEQITSTVTRPTWTGRCRCTRSPTKLSRWPSWPAPRSA
jgi:hypothetical protein